MVRILDWMRQRRITGYGHRRDFWRDRVMIRAFLTGMNPWVVLAVVAALAGALAMAYRSGYGHSTDAAASEKLAAVSRAIEQSQSIAKEDMAIASANIQTVEVIRNRTRTIRIKESAHAAKNPLPAVCVLDAERMRNANAALAGHGEAAADTGKPDYGLPTTTGLGQQ